MSHSLRVWLNLGVAVTPGSACSSQYDFCNAMRAELQYAAPLAEGKPGRSDLDKPAVWAGRNSIRDKLPMKYS